MQLFEKPASPKKMTLPNGAEMPKAHVIYYPSFFDKQESDFFFQDLLDNIAWQQDQIKFYGKLLDLPRLEAWYGEVGKDYTYSGIAMKSNAWTESLLRIKARIEETTQARFTNALLNQYRTGKDSVGWHSDDEHILGVNPVIGSVTFGASRRFMLRYKDDHSLKSEVLLEHGSFLLMAGETQHTWQHQIPKTTQKLGIRINLTFRVLI